ncbi:hypothetical protein J2W14_002540 [Pseudarthrobacter oxydans]|uniref:hypothetical protein n=1 Tax=Pseudarthrobacter oxydans TaxID=1671 RepID=UPI002781940D|nr:hypothetical protein [Pseudarthrobacter oxydans]MDP9983127.1 hypothetical protein [Pseudarthrobacter oxydans]
MGLIYDNPDLVALTLTRLAAEESEGPGALERRMLDYLGDLEQRNGTAFLELVAITLARIHFKSLDDLARATGADSAGLLDAAEVEALEGYATGS